MSTVGDRAQLAVLRAFVERIACDDFTARELAFGGLAPLARSALFEAEADAVRAEERAPRHDQLGDAMTFLLATWSDDEIDQFCRMVRG